MRTAMLWNSMYQYIFLCSRPRVKVQFKAYNKGTLDDYQS